MWWKWKFSSKLIWWNSILGWDLPSYWCCIELLLLGVGLWNVMLHDDLMLCNSLNEWLFYVCTALTGFRNDLMLDLWSEMICDAWFVAIVSCMYYCRIYGYHDDDACLLMLWLAIALACKFKWTVVVTLMWLMWSCVWCMCVLMMII